MWTFCWTETAAVKLISRLFCLLLVCLSPSFRQRDDGALPGKQTLSSSHQGGSFPQNQLPGLPEIRPEVPAPQSSVTRDRLHPHQGGAEGAGHQELIGGTSQNSACVVISKKKPYEYIKFIHIFVHDVENWWKATFRKVNKVDKLQILSYPRRD